MNRSILIVICDFLLVSLLAFSTVDINKVADQGATSQLKMDMTMATNQVESGKDLAAVMRLALTEEQKNRDLLMSELTKSRETLGKQQQELQSREQQGRQLQEQQSNLKAEYAAAQTNIQTLTERLQNTTSETLISKEKLAAMEAELKKQAEQAAAMQQELSQLARSNQVVQSERQRLAGQLQVAEVEKRHATEQVVRMQDEVKYEREEKAKLAEGVKVLASKSGELTQEIRENRPLAPNTIFNQFLTNRVEARFSASRSTVFGGNKRKDTQTVLATDGTNIVALCHVQDTPLTLWNPGVEWEALAGTMARNAALVPVRSLSFSLQDPRIAFVPITKAEAKQLGSKIYPISPDPYKFQDAVLVGATEGYYGECRFEIDPSTPDYVKLDRNFLKGLFGKFNPSRGDLVLSKTGDLLGIMANNTYCMMIRNFDSAAAFRFGPDVRAQNTGDTLSLLYARVAELPLKLQ
jgi:predicted nuclease with TOPRIM domain